MDRPLLTLSIDHDEGSYTSLSLFSMQCCDGEIMRYGPPSEPPNIETGFHSLACLIVHDLIRRRTGSSYSTMAVERHQHLKTTWRAAKATPNKKPLWVRDLFSGDPFNRFIESRGGENHFEIWFNQEIDLAVKSARSDKDLPTSVLVKLREHLTRPKPDFTESFEIEIIRGLERITGKSSGQFLRHGDDIQVFIQANYSTNLLVFWICNDGEVHCLFPDIDPDLHDKPSDILPFKSNLGFQLTIPDSTTVEVDSTHGVDTCLATIRNEDFSATDQEVIKSLLEKCSQHRNGNAKLSAPEAKKLEALEDQVETVKTRTSMGLTRSKKLDKWEALVQSHLKDHCTNISVLHIPVK